MDDVVIDDETLPLERKSVLPGAGFFTPDAVDEERAALEAAERLGDADVAVVADPDADGLACVALVREAFGDAALYPAGPHELDRALAYLEEYFHGHTAVICDLCPDDRDKLPGLEALAGQVDVRWYDHHQWDAGIAEAVEDAGVELVIGESEAECSADVALRSLDHEFEARFSELAAVTRDHDLWLREDPRSDDLADFAHWSEPEEYVATVREHGPNLPPAAETLLAERRIEKEALIEKAVARAELREVGDVTVGITYGRCSQNEVAEALREQGADASVVVKPAGSASIRGTDAFARCHEVAAQVNGGGHPKAAGCKPDIYDDMLDYAHHWTTRGAVAKQVILDAFRHLAPPDESAS